MPMTGWYVVMMAIATCVAAQMVIDVIRKVIDLFELAKQPGVHKVFFWAVTVVTIFGVIVSIAFLGVASTCLKYGISEYWFREKDNRADADSEM